MYRPYGLGLKELFMKILSLFHGIIKGWSTILCLLPDDDLPKIEVKKIIPYSSEEGMQHDWQKVGSSMRCAIGKIDKEIHTSVGSK
jgi:hypothetical protein